MGVVDTLQINVSNSFLLSLSLFLPFSFSPNSLPVIIFVIGCVALER